MIDLLGFITITVTIGSTLINFNLPNLWNGSIWRLKIVLCEHIQNLKRGILRFIEGDNISFGFCNNCKVINACILVGNLKGCIHVLGGALVYVIEKIDWIEAIVGVNEKALLSLHQYNRILVIQMSFVINLHGSFLLTLLGNSLVFRIAIRLIE